MDRKYDVLMQPLELPCGVTVKNRFFKAPMNEAMGTKEFGPSPELARLYRRWALGGTGVLVTGNVMVDQRHLGEPGNVGSRTSATWPPSRSGPPPAPPTVRSCGCSSTIPACSRPAV